MPCVSHANAVAHDEITTREDLYSAAVSDSPSQSQSHREHKATSPTTVRCAVLTVSDTRTEANDTGGRAIVTLLAEHGHEVVFKQIVRDEPDQVRALIEGWIEGGTRGDAPEQVERQVQVIITTGGTGISSRDRKYEAVTGLLDKQLDGFGELFRMLSFQEIGAGAMLSRACAGVARGRIIICLPGSEHAVRLAMTRLILPELGHLVREISR
jgi:molybdenum cofactor biosynthesis protein B